MPEYLEFKNYAKTVLVIAVIDCALILYDQREPLASGLGLQFARFFIGLTLLFDALSLSWYLNKRSGVFVLSPMFLYFAVAQRGHVDIFGVSVWWYVPIFLFVHGIGPELPRLLRLMTERLSRR